MRANCGTVISVVWQYFYFEEEKGAGTGSFQCDSAISFGNVNLYMYAHRNRPLSTEVDFLPDSPPSYHSATSPVTYPPQRVRLLSDVNVYNDYFSADQHYER